jgi:hypothetical protein
LHAIHDLIIPRPKDEFRDEEKPATLKGNAKIKATLKLTSQKPKANSQKPKAKSRFYSPYPALQVQPAPGYALRTR